MKLFLLISLLAIFPWSMGVAGEEATIATASLEGPKLVSSVEEFYVHTRLHRARVKVLGLDLYKNFPDHFKGLTSDQVASVLEAHDLAKVSASSVGPDGKPFYRVLYDHYGQRIERNVIDALNAADKKFMADALKTNQVTSVTQIAMMERIEKIADLVDRGMSIVSAEEFGRPMSKASEWLTDPLDKKLAKELEKKYSQIVSKLQYRKLLHTQQEIVSKHLTTQEGKVAKIKPNTIESFSNGPRRCISSYLKVLKTSPTQFVN